MVISSMAGKRVAAKLYHKPLQACEPRGIENRRRPGRIDLRVMEFRAKVRGCDFLL
jgi:hypothetical protein